MTREQGHDVLERLIDALNERDMGRAMLEYAEDAVVESPSTGRHRGRDQIAQSYERWISAFPDVRLTVESIVAEHDRAVLVFHAAGTHGAEFLGFPATGKRIEFNGVFVQRFVEGKIVHERRIYDFSGVLIKLGVLKVKPT